MLGVQNKNTTKRQKFKASYYAAPSANAATITEYPPAVVCSSKPKRFKESVMCERSDPATLDYSALPHYYNKVSTRIVQGWYQDSLVSRRQAIEAPPLNYHGRTVSWTGV